MEKLEAIRKKSTTLTENPIDIPIMFGDSLTRYVSRTLAAELPIFIGTMSDYWVNDKSAYVDEDVVSETIGCKYKLDRDFVDVVMLVLCKDDIVPECLADFKMCDLLALHCTLTLISANVSNYGYVTAEIDDRFSKFQAFYKSNVIEISKYQQHIAGRLAKGVEKDLSTDGGIEKRKELISYIESLDIHTERQKRHIDDFNADMSTYVVDNCRIDRILAARAIDYRTISCDNQKDIVEIAEIIILYEKLYRKLESK